MHIPSCNTFGMGQQNGFADTNISGGGAQARHPSPGSTKLRDDAEGAELGDASGEATGLLTGRKRIGAD